MRVGLPVRAVSPRSRLSTDSSSSRATVAVCLLVSRCDEFLRRLLTICAQVASTLVKE